MSQLKIVQSLTLLHVASMNTYDAVLVDGKEALRLQGAEDVLMTELPAISEFMVVLPVMPSIGDTVVSYFEGNLISGTIAVIDGGDFIINVDDVGLISLARNQFHVTGVVGATDVSGLSTGAQLVSTSEDSANFPFGSKATLNHVGQTKGLPPSTIIMVKNNLGWTWDATNVTFRVFDPTIVNFTFEDEVETILAAPDAEIEAEVDALTVDIETLAGIPDLEGDGFVFVLTDIEGNPIDWASVPDDVRESVTKIADEIKAKAPLGVLEADFELKDVAGEVGDEEAVFAPGPNFDEFLEMLLGSTVQAAADAARDDHIDALAQASAADDMQHKLYVSSGLNDADASMDKAIQKLSLGMNLLGRMATEAKDARQFAQFENIASILAESRNAMIEVSKTHLDIVTDIKVNDAIQFNYLELMESA